MFSLAESGSFPDMHSPEKRNDVMSVNNYVQYSSHDESSDDVEHGVLLQKHGRQDDGYTEYKGTEANPSVFAQIRVCTA